MTFTRPLMIKREAKTNEEIIEALRDEIGETRMMIFNLQDKVRHLEALKQSPTEDNKDD